MSKTAFIICMPYHDGDGEIHQKPLEICLSKKDINNVTSRIYIVLLKSTLSVYKHGIKNNQLTSLQRKNYEWRINDLENEIRKVEITHSVPEDYFEILEVPLS